MIVPVWASSVRMTRENAMPTRPNAPAVHRYMMPIFLWSTVVNHSRITRQAFAPAYVLVCAPASVAIVLPPSA